MKVTIVRGGGIAGIVTRTELSEGALPHADAQAFAEKVAHADVRQPTPPAAGHRLPDEQLYEVVLEEGDDRRSVRFTDSTLPDGVRHLVEWIDARPEQSRSVDPPPGG